MALYAPLPMITAGVVFAGLYLALRPTPYRVVFLLLPAVAFIGAGLEEWYMRVYEPETDIRMDALLFLALMALSLMIGVPAAFTRRRRREPASPSGSATG